MLSRKSLCDGLIPRPEEFYLVYVYICVFVGVYVCVCVCVWVCVCECVSVGDLENLNNEAAWARVGL